MFTQSLRYHTALPRTFQSLLRIPFASDEAQLGVTGEDLLKALVPICGDIVPMVYVNDTLYRIVDPQPNFADEKSSFNLLGKIESTVSSSEEPKENFQANDDICLLYTSDAADE